MRLCFWLLLFSVSVHGVGSKTTPYLKDVMALPAAIYDVKGMGKWQKGKEVGQIRLVITRNDKRDDVFIQWVSWDLNGPKQVKSTQFIKEILEEGNFKTTFIRRENNMDVRQITVGLENQHDKTHSRAVISIDDVGVYHCEFQ